MKCEASFTQYQNDVADYVTIASSICSLFGSSFMLTTFFSFSKGKKISKLVSFLALGDFGWSITVISTFLVKWFLPNSYTYIPCLILRVSFQIFSMSSVLWTAIISHYIRAAIQRSREGKTRPNLNKANWFFYLAIAWGIPIFLALALAFAKWIKQDPVTKLCYPIKPYHMIFWFLPNLLAFLYTTINCGFIIKLVRGIPRNYWVAIKRHGILTLPIEIRVLLYLLVFFISWPLDIITNAMSYAPQFEHCQIYELFITYQFTLQFQGALDAIVFGITNKQLRAHYKNKPMLAITTFLLSPILVFPFFISYVVKKMKRKDTELKEEKKPMLDTSERATSFSSHSSFEPSLPQIPKELYRSDILYSNNAN